MGRSVEVGVTTDIIEGKMKSITAEGREILLARVGGNIYAVSNKCPHLGGNLSKGILEGSIVTCPLHSSQFNIITGEVVRWMKGSGLIASIGKSLKHPAVLETYNVSLQGDRIFIEI